ncbi:MAG: hypothetical protein QXK95_01590 [Nitrososphaerota archaeon]|nr:hypothetical protein [Candidatus Geocrenenecus dongiae]
MSDSERKFFENILREQHGVEKAFREYILIKTGEDRIRATTHETIEVAMKLRKILQIGLYIAKFRKSRNEVFLTIEGSQLLNDQITKNVVDLDEESALRWMKGAPIQLPRNYLSLYIVGRLNGLYLGSARISRDGKAYPQISTWRRIPEGE